MIYCVHCQHKHRGVEQLVARRAHNPKVAGSSPVPTTSKAASQKGGFFVTLCSQALMKLENFFSRLLSTGRKKKHHASFFFILVAAFSLHLLFPASAEPLALRYRPT